MAENYPERIIEPDLLKHVKNFAIKRAAIFSGAIEECTTGDAVVNVLGSLIDDLWEIRRASLGKLSGADPDSLEIFISRFKN